MNQFPRSSSGARSGGRPGRARVRRARAATATIEPGTSLAGWAYVLGPPGPERPRPRVIARAGGLIAVAALLTYLCWRITSTLPTAGWDRRAAWILVGFEALPLAGLVVRLVTLWNIDGRAPRPVIELPAEMRVAVLIPTYNEAVEVIAPTIAAPGTSADRSTITPRRAT